MRIFDSLIGRGGYRHEIILRQKSSYFNRQIYLLRFIEAIKAGQLVDMHSGARRLVDIRIELIDGKVYKFSTFHDDIELDFVGRDDSKVVIYKDTMAYRQIDIRCFDYPKGNEIYEVIAIALLYKIQISTIPSRRWARKQEG